MTSVDVTIAVLTFRRPDDLQKVLPALLHQIEELPEDNYRVRVLVVDNDPASSARAVADAFATAAVEYAVEPEAGIAAARNRALEESAGSQLLIFIDDDETPQQRWLIELLGAQRRTRAVAVAGAVVSEFDGELDPWLVAGGFFSRRRLTTGTVIHTAATNNLLLDLAVVRRLNLRFDPDFGLSGGEDTLFTRTLGSENRSMVWCDEAVVTDRVPRTRMTRRWVVLRAVSSGNSEIRVRHRMAAGSLPKLRARWDGLAIGLPRLALGSLRWLGGTVIGSARHQARGLRTAARGAGMLSAAFGYVYQEYRRR